MQKMRRRKERQEHTYASTEYLCSCDVSCRTTTTAMTTTTMTTTTIGERPHLRLYFLFFFYHSTSPVAFYFIVVYSFGALPQMEQNNNGAKHVLLLGATCKHFITRRMHRIRMI